MRQTLAIVGAWVALALGASHGYTQTLEIPGMAAPGAASESEQNPVFIPLGKESYHKVFESVLQVLGDAGFDIQESNRYDGRVETIPRIAPGIGFFLKRGSPSIRERLLASLQTYRHRVSAVIQPADHGGYFIEIIVRKELEDLPRPIRATAGAAIFRNYNNVERQFQVIDPTVFEATWIYKGRDVALEQKLINHLKKCL